MKLSLVNSFLFFLILISSSPSKISGNPPTTSHRKQTLTVVAIQELCGPTRNPDLCTQLLNKYKGTPLTHKPLINLVNTLQIQAAQMKKNILYIKKQAVESNQPEFVARCWDEYVHVVTHLRDAAQSISQDRIGDVKTFVSNAIGSVDSCDELAKARRNHSAIGKHNNDFRDYSSVVMALCDKLLHHAHAV